jgi:23S rRNA (cytosine1962-C5)-methyltransferase
MGIRKVSSSQPAAQVAKSRGQTGGQLRLRISTVAESIVRSGHPWLFADSIRTQSRTGAMGELAVIYDRNDRFLALGLFDPTSAIRLRVLHTGKPRRVDRTFWREKLDRAIERRNGLFDLRTTGYRWINGESDGLPGVVMDRYETTLVLKLYTAAWLPWLETLVAEIEAKLHPERIVLRLSRNIQDFVRMQIGRRDGDVIEGMALDRPVVFLESGLRFEADVARGQKTGFFLDQRENRRKVENLARGRSMLNAFSFSGGFSLYAARGGARSIVDLDISAHALAAAERNLTLNQSERDIAACPRDRIQADAFEWLAANRKRKFDLVVLDPPSLAKRENERAAAIAAYHKLAALGIEHLSTGGILIACSCSAHVTEAEFFEAVLGAATKSKGQFNEMLRAGQPSDHPADFEESRYLKAIYLRSNTSR